MLMLLALAIVLLIIAIAGGVIIHPVIFALALVALVLFFSGRRGAARLDDCEPACAPPRRVVGHHGGPSAGVERGSSS